MKLYRISRATVDLIKSAQDPTAIWIELGAAMGFDPATVQRTERDHIFYAEPVENGI